MKMEDSKPYYAIKMGIYPRILYIIKGNIKEETYNKYFQGRNGEELKVEFGGNNGSCVWDVIEKDTNKCGFLVRLYRVEGIDTLAHEAVHVAFDTFHDIDAVADEDNQEPFAYLVEWVTKQLYNVYKNKK